MGSCRATYSYTAQSLGICGANYLPLKVRLGWPQGVWRANYWFPLWALRGERIKKFFGPLPCILWGVRIERNSKILFLSSLWSKTVGTFSGCPMELGGPFVLIHSFFLRGSLILQIVLIFSSPSNKISFCFL